MRPRGSDDRATVSRRSLAKTAAHAAWAVPVIAVATAAPAQAVSAPSLLAASIYGSGGGNTRANVNVQIDKAFGSHAIASVLVQVTMTPVPGITLGTDVVVTSASFALVGSPTLSSGVLVANFTSTITPMFPATVYTQRLLQFNVGLTNPGNIYPRGTMSALVTPTSGPAVTTLPAPF